MATRFDRLEAGLNLTSQEKHALDNIPVRLDGIANRLMESAKADCEAELAEDGAPSGCGLRQQQRAKFLPEDFVFYCDNSCCPALAPAAARDALAGELDRMIES
ncbi:MAG TPA: hypothetical protein VFL85_04085 [Candidatus Saccharimonadales bacterium]|nr:hypothetical protein [Candidatus Saccharimonadales bacterium]